MTVGPGWWGRRAGVVVVAAALVSSVMPVVPPDAAAQELGFPPPAPESVYESWVLADQPWLFYRLGESAGPVAVDSSTNDGRDGVFADGATLGVAGALSFDDDTAVAGSSAVASTGSATLPPADSGLTVELWVRLDGNEAGWLVGFESGFGLRVGDSGSVVGVALDADGGLVGEVALPYSIASGGWHLVHLVVSPEGDVLVGLDGQWVGSVDAGDLVGVPGPEGPMVVGGVPGAFDELAVYAQALAADRMATRWRSGAGLSLADCPDYEERSSYAQAVLARDPVAYLRLGELGDGDVRVAWDAAACRSAAIAPDAQVVPGALAGDPDTAMGSAGGPVVVRDAAGLPVAGDRSVELWVEDPGGDGWLAAVGGSWGADLVDGGAALRIVDDAEAGTVPLVDPVTGAPFGLDGGGWRQVVVTLSGGVGSVFVDGALVGSAALADPVEPVPGTALMVGGAGGSIDEFAIYAEALDAAAVADGFAAAAVDPPSPACGPDGPDGYEEVVLGDGPVRYFRFSELGEGGLAWRARDVSVGCRHGFYTPLVRDGRGALAEPDPGVLAVSTAVVQSEVDGLPGADADLSVEAWVAFPIVSWARGWLVRRADAWGVELVAADVVGVVHDGRRVEVELSGPVADGLWRHLAVTVAGADVVVYLDGTLAGQGLLVDPAPEPVPGTGFRVGGAPGLYDEVAVHAGALDAAAVAARPVARAAGLGTQCGVEPPGVWAEVAGEAGAVRLHRFLDIADDPYGAAARDSSAACASGWYGPLVQGASEGGVGLVFGPGPLLVGPGAGLAGSAEPFSVELAVVAAQGTGWLARHGGAWGVELVAPDRVAVVRGGGRVELSVPGGGPVEGPVVVSVDGAGVARLFLAGALVAEEPLVAGADPVPGDGFVLGGDGLELMAGFAGAAVYDRDLDPAEVELLAVAWAEPACAAAHVAALASGYGSEVLADDPARYYRLGERWADSDAPEALDATLTCAVAPFTGGAVGVGGALATDADGAVAGTSDLVVEPAAAVPAADDGLTVEVWAGFDGPEPDGWMVRAGGDWGVRATPAGLEVVTEGRRAAVPLAWDDPGSWRLWHVVVGEADVAVYRDGVELATALLVEDPAAGVPGAGLIVGGAPGRYDELAIYPGVLDVGRIEQRWSTAMGVDDPGVCAPVAGAYQAVVLADDPARYYRFGERLTDPDAVVARDAAAPCVDGTYQPGVVGTAGAVSDDPDGAAHRGDGPVVVASGSGLPGAAGAVTVEAWVAPDAAAGDGWLARSGGQWGVRRVDGGLEVLSASGPRRALVPVTLPADEWSLLHVVVDAGEARVHLDGAEAGRAPLVLDPAAVVPGPGFVVGGVAGGYDEVAVYEGALDQDRIAARWFAAAALECGPAPGDDYGAAVLDADPLRYYRLDDRGDAPEPGIAADAASTCAPGSYAEDTAPAPGLLGTGAGTDGAAVQAGPAGVLTAPVAGLPGPDDDLTVEVWFDPAGPPEGDWLVRHGGRWGVRADATSVQVVRDGQQATLEVPVPHLAGWFATGPMLLHVTITAWGQVTVFRDGHRWATAVLEAGGGPVDGTGFVVGSAPGRYGDVALYDRVLDAAEVHDRWMLGATGGPAECAGTDPAPYAAVVLADDPLGYFRLGDLAAEPGGRVAADSSEHCRPASYGPTAAGVSGAIAEDPDAAAAAGGGWAWLADGAPYFTDDLGAVEVWFRTPASPAGVVGIDGTVVLAGPDGLAFQGPGAASPELIAPLEPGAWHHVVIRVVGVAADEEEALEVVLDGASVGIFSPSSGGWTGSPSPWSGLIVAGWGDIVIDELALYAVAVDSDGNPVVALDDDRIAARLVAAAALRETTTDLAVAGGTTFGEAASLTATVTADGSPHPVGGAVVFVALDGEGEEREVAAADVVDGTATAEVFLRPEPLTLVAGYEGEDHHLASESIPVPIDVAMPVPTLAVDPTALVFGQRPDIQVDVVPPTPDEFTVAALLDGAWPPTAPEQAVVLEHGYVFWVLATGELPFDDPESLDDPPYGDRVVAVSFDGTFDGSDDLSWVAPIPAGSHDLRVYSAYLRWVPDPDSGEVDPKDLDSLRVSWSESATVSVEVESVATTVEVGSDPNPSGLGEPVTLTATVAPVEFESVPTGFVTFSVDGTAVGVVGLDGGGAATLTLDDLPEGASTVVASYGGSADHLPAESEPHEHVAVVPTATVLDGPAESVAGDPVVFTAQVAPTVATGIEVTGPVVFELDGAPQATIGLDASDDGLAEWVASIDAGDYEVTARYLGHGVFAPSASVPLAHHRAAFATTTTLEVDASAPVPFGAPVTVTATVEAASGEGLAPSGAVAISGLEEEPVVVAVAPVPGEPASASAEVTVDALEVGAHELVASYGGDGSFAASESPVAPVEIVAGAVTVEVVSTPEPSADDDEITLEATVVPVAPSTRTPQGTVEFVVDGTAVDEVVLTGGSASTTIDPLAVGDHELAAEFVPADGYASATATATHRVRHAVAVAVATSDEAPSFGEPVTFTATVTAVAPGAPPVDEGAVRFAVDGVGPVEVPVADGTAVWEPVALDPGSWVVTATYLGSDSFAVGEDSLVQSVAPGTATITLEVDPAGPTSYGSPGTVRATVSPELPATETPTGFVTLTAGPDVLAVISLEDGIAEWGLSALPAGEHVLTATYGGSDRYAPSGPTDPHPHTITPADSAVLLAVPTGIRAGQTVELAATVGSDVDAVPSGFVFFTVEVDDDPATTVALGTATVDAQDGTATLTTNELPLGPVVISAHYGGSTNFQPSQTATDAQVNPAHPATATLAIDPGLPTLHGEEVTLGATVVGAEDELVPTGTVRFRVDGTTLGDPVPLTPDPETASSSVALVTNAIPPGAWPITVAYDGDAHHSPAVSPPTTHVVSPRDRLVLSSVPDALSAGEPSELVTVELRDADDAPRPAPAGGLEVSLTAGSITGEFLSPTEPVTITGVTITAGNTDATFRYRNPMAGSTDIRVDAPAGTGVLHDSAEFSVTPGAAATVSVDPDVVTVPPGASQSFKVTAFDEHHNRIGDVSADSTVTVEGAPCPGAACTGSAGSHTVTATYGAAEGQATLIGANAPVVSIAPVGPSTVTAPATLAFTVDAEVGDVTDLEFTVDFGDGSATTAPQPLPTDGVTISHDYETDCAGCIVVVAVDDGITQPVVYASTVIDVRRPEPARARFGDDRVALAGEPVRFDGEASRPVADLVDGYTWSFGDGTDPQTTTASRIDHTYTQPGVYTASLAVDAAGDVATSTVQVHVLDPALLEETSARVALVDGDSGTPITGASVVWARAGLHYQATELGGGEYLLHDTWPGTYTVYAYQAGYRPATFSVAVPGGIEPQVVALEPGDPGEVEIRTRRLEPDEALALGVDADHVDNQLVYQFIVEIHFDGEDRIRTEGVGHSSIPPVVTAGGDGPQPVPLPCRRDDGCGFAGGSIPVAFLRVPGQAQWLKEFFEVELTVVNVSPEGFTLSGGAASLELPAGLSLAAMDGDHQPYFQDVPDLPAGAHHTAGWIVRGDVEGEYDVEGAFAAALDPVGQPVHLAGRTAPEERIRVVGGSAVALTMAVDERATQFYPYHVDVTLENTSEIPIHNPSVTLFHGDGYLLQPRQQPAQADQLAPGAELTGRFVLAPFGFGDQVDIDNTVVSHVGGQPIGDPIVVEKGPDHDDPGGPDPDDPDDDKFSPPIVATFTGVHWIFQFSAVDTSDGEPGVLRYELFEFTAGAEPDGEETFDGWTFVGSTDSPGDTPAIPLDESTQAGAVFAVSTVFDDGDGGERWELRHPLVFDSYFQYGLTDPEAATGDRFDPAQERVPEIDVAVPGAPPPLMFWQAAASACPKPGGGSPSRFGGPFGTRGIVAGECVRKRRADAMVSTVGPPLEVARTYLSGNERRGAFGLGWSFNLDRRVYVDGGMHATVDSGDGGFRLFERPHSSASLYAPRSDGEAAELHVHPDGRWTLMEKDGTRYEFDSGRRLDRIVDPAGRRLLLSYEDGRLDRAWDETSGRSLYFSWTGRRITEVRTDPVTVGEGPPAPLVWTYDYDGSDRLVSACAPGDDGPRCTTYEYDPDVGIGGRLVRVVTPEGLVRAEYGYDETGRRTLVRDGAGNETAYAFVTLPEDGQRLTTTDPDGVVRVTDLDAMHRVVRADTAGMVVDYEYDAAGFLAAETYANGESIAFTWTAEGDLLEATVAPGETYRYGYDDVGNLVSIRSPAATEAEATQRSFITEARLLLSETRPPTADHPDPYPIRYGYSSFTADGTPTGSDPAVGGGVTPPGLLRFEFDERDPSDPNHGHVEYRYDATGDLREVIDRAGLVSEMDYDELGRLRALTIADPDRGPQTWTFTYDQAGHLARTTEPPAANLVAGTDHQLEVTRAHDRDGRLTETRVRDLVAGGERITTIGYDAAGRVASIAGPDGGVTGHEYDGARRTVIVEPDGRRIRTTYGPDHGLPVRVHVENWSDPTSDAPAGPRDLVAERIYDLRGRPVEEVDGAGRRFVYDYDPAGRQVAISLVDRAGGLDDVVVSEVEYDGAGRPVVERAADGARTLERTWSARDELASETLVMDFVHPLLGETPDRVTTYRYDAASNLTRTSLEADFDLAWITPTPEVIEYGYDVADRLVAMSVAPDTLDLRTTYEYDLRGLLTRTVPPRGHAEGPAEDFATEYVYDGLGRQVEVHGPRVVVDDDGPLVRPTRRFGYDGFGNVVDVEDEAGARTGFGHDAMDRLVRVEHPVGEDLDGVALEPVEELSYDLVGNLVASTDALGAVTELAYDSDRRLVEVAEPAPTPGGAPPTSRVAYDLAGNPVVWVDPVGARVEADYDDLGRLVASRELVRDPEDPGTPPEVFTTEFGYDALGNQTSLVRADGATWTGVYSPASELVATVDPAGELVRYAYDAAGRLVFEADELLRLTILGRDAAGRVETAEEFRLGPDWESDVYRAEHLQLDAAGNVTQRMAVRSWDPPEFSHRFSTYDAGDRLVEVRQPTEVAPPYDYAGEDAVSALADPSVVDPTDAVTGYGYDRAGRITRVIDAEGRVSERSWNAWGLLAELVEPATDAHPALVDRRWRYGYDVAGRLAVEEAPGGVVVEHAYDLAGRLVGSSGSGPDPSVPDAVRSFEHDLAGRLVGVDHPDGMVAVGHDDRGLVVSASGPAGTASFDYDGVGRLVGRSDGSGSAVFSWTDRDELAGWTEPLTGVSLAHSYDAVGRLVRVEGSDGTDEFTRELVYDDRAVRVDAFVTDESSWPLAGMSYEYDLEDRETSRFEWLPNALFGTHGFDYDRAGRLVSWSQPENSFGSDGAVVAYEWDRAGNLLTDGAGSYAYDERDRLVTHPDGSLAWSARGTLEELAVGDADPVAVTFDALGRLVGADGVGFAYDGLDRVASRTVGSETIGFGYAGLGADPVTAGVEVFSRDARAGIAATGSTEGEAVLVARNRHGDVAFTHSPDASVVASTVYGPFGVPAATSGGDDQPAVGFQGDWTDPDLGLVWMGARWYAPGLSGFVSRDPWPGDSADPATLNRYAYGLGDPLGHVDRDGYSASAADGTSEVCEPAQGQRCVGVTIGPDRFHVAHRVGALDATDPSSWGVLHASGGGGGGGGQSWGDRLRGLPGQALDFARGLPGHLGGAFRWVANDGWDWVQDSLLDWRNWAKLLPSLAAGIGCGIGGAAVGGPAGALVAGSVCFGATWRFSSTLLDGGSPLDALRRAARPVSVLTDAVLGLVAGPVGRLLAPLARPIVRFAASQLHRARSALPRPTPAAANVTPTAHSANPRMASGAESAAQGAWLRQHLRLTEEYGSAGVRELADGRIRYYGALDPARKPGEMAGRRLVQEWNPVTSSRRAWHETVDHLGRVRIVRPESGGSKIHYMFDEFGNFVGRF